LGKLGKKLCWESWENTVGKVGKTLLGMLGYCWEKCSWKKKLLLRKLGKTVLGKHCWDIVGKNAVGKKLLLIKLGNTLLGKLGKKLCWENTVGISLGKNYCWESWENTVGNVGILLGKMQLEKKTTVEKVGKNSVGKTLLGYCW
jgi:hypothetical protein